MRASSTSEIPCVRQHVQGWPKLIGGSWPKSPRRSSRLEPGMAPSFKANVRAPIAGTTFDLAPVDL